MSNIFADAMTPTSPHGPRFDWACKLFPLTAILVKDMGKTATRKRTSSTKSDSNPDYLVMFEAKQRFIGSVLNLGWRLAITFLLPVFIGAWLDRKFNSAPSYTLTAIIIAIVASAMVIWSTVKEVNAETAELDKETSSKRKKHV